MSESEPVVCRLHAEQIPFNDVEKEEFRKLIKEHHLERRYQDFKLNSCQQLRSRLGQDPFLDKNLDLLFEIGSISGI